MKKNVYLLFNGLFIILLLGLSRKVHADEINFTTSYETNPSKTEQFSMKIRAEYGATYYIDYGDGAGVQTKKSYGYTDYLYYTFADMATNKIHKVKVWGGPLVEFTIISNRKVSEITLKECNELLKFSCSWSDIKVLDLTSCPKLKDVICNANEIEELKLPASAKNLTFERNRLSLAKFPEKKSYVYSYGPMRPVYLEKSKINGLKVDLTDFLNYNGTTSKFSWYRYDNHGNNADPAMLIEPSTYKEENGIFTFNEAYDTEIYCVVENSALPKLNNINDHYGIMPIKLEGKAKELEAVHVAFTTDKFTTDNLTFDLGLSSVSDNSPCMINWGDGVIEEITLNKTETIVKHNFLDAQVDKQHLVQIQCQDLAMLKFPELCGFLGFNEGTVESPVKRVLLDHNRLQTIDFSLFKHAEELSANSCYANKIILPQTQTLLKLSLAGNQVNELNIADYIHLKELNVERNKLAEVDLSKMTELEKVNIAFNQIYTLKMPTDYEKLKEMNCGNNTIPMYMLPEKCNMENYIYAPQRPYLIPSKLIKENVVDLSLFNNLKGVTGKPQPTNYIWLNKNDTSIPIMKGLHYDEIDGKFTFKLKEDVEIYCSMQTDAFPDLATEGVGYRTKPILIKAVPLSVNHVKDDTTPIKLLQNGNLVTLTSNGDNVVTIYNIEGKQIKALNIKNNENVIIELSSGVYIAKVQGYGVIKFVVL